MSVIETGNLAPVVCRALWTWDTSGLNPVAIGYGDQETPTKTGLTPDDLRAFVGVPIQTGNPPVQVDDQTILRWIRWTEDRVEQQTGLLLCPTWVASPPTRTAEESLAVGLVTSGAGGQQLGIDYDKRDAAYDFFFPRSQDEGWMIQNLRYRPLRGIHATDYTAVKNLAYIYPLLNTFFRAPPSWEVEDYDAALIRLVPAANVQMLPLFAMQLAFTGPADSVPGGMWFQYTAGLDANDYNSNWSFVLQLVLSLAAVQALSTIQTSINFGVAEVQVTVDGLGQKLGYDKRGPYAAAIDRFTQQAKDLMKEVKNKISGPNFIVI